MRVAVNKNEAMLNALVSELFGWDVRHEIQWLSPIASDDYAEYYDNEFLDLLGVVNLAVPLSTFWPSGGPRWDGLAKTNSGKKLLVEAKAYIEEGVDYGSKAESDESLKQISQSLAMTKDGFKAAKKAPLWETPFYQYTNRLAHLYFLRQLNGIDAYLLFLYFADAPDVPLACTKQQWEGADRLVKRALGLPTRHPFSDYVGTLILGVPDMQSNGG
jgi:hypothetical protein